MQTQLTTDLCYAFVGVVVKASLSAQEVWRSIPRPVKSDSLANAAIFLWNCVAQVLSRGDGPATLTRFGVIP